MGGSRLVAVTPILAAVIFFVLGFTVHGAWAWAWLVFFAVPIVAILSGGGRR
jgi:hypothetical protein